MSTAALERLLAPLREAGERPLLFADGRSYAADELLARSADWAARLRRQGLMRGDRVAVLATAQAASITVMLALHRAGLVHVPINDRYRGEELRHVVEDSGARLLLCDPQLADARLDALPGELPRASLGAAGARPGLAPGERPWADDPASDDDTALLVYTSGTTGRSKGVELSRRGVVDNIAALTDSWRWSRRDVLSLALPLFHVHGLCIGVYGALLHGMPVRLHRRFDPAAIVDDFERDATVFMGVPTMYERLLEHVTTSPDAGRILARGRLFTAGSAALRPALLERWQAHTGHRILERYGMSETLITLSNPHDEERRPGAVGFPVPGCEVRVVDERGVNVEAGQQGELWVRAPWIMRGYWGQPAATEAAFTDGWFRTGDVVVADSDGYLHIVGRRSTDIIKSGGFKIAAPEIERVLLEHPAVREAAVVGLPDPRWGERIAAAIVCEGAQAPTLEDLAAWVGEHLADYKRPRQLAVVDALPRNALGKLQKPRIVAAMRRAGEGEP